MKKREFMFFAYLCGQIKARMLTAIAVAPTPFTHNKQLIAVWRF